MRSRVRAVKADAAIAALAKLPALEHLSLEQHDAVTDAGIIPLFAAKSPATLRSLELVNTPLTDATARAIARSPKARALESLSLHNSNLTLDGIAELVTSTSNLRRIRITSAATNAEYRAGYEALLLALPRTHALREVETWIHEVSDALRARYETTAPDRD